MLWRAGVYGRKVVQQFERRVSRQQVDARGRRLLPVQLVLRAKFISLGPSPFRSADLIWWWSRYDTCNHTGGFRAALAADGQQQPEAEREGYRRGRGGGLPPQLRGAGPAEGGAHPLPLRNLAYPCGGEQAMQVYMGLPQVKAALHVPPDAVFYDSDGMGAQYTYGSRDQRPWYRKVVGEGRLRILVYSGDADTCVNTLWSEWWTSGLGISEVESWRGWTMDNETAMAGYVTRYAHDFDFLTVRGAGHM